MGDLTERAVSWLAKQAGQPAPFFLYFAPVAVHELVTPSAETTLTSKAGPYGDFIHDLDRSVGRIIAALEKQNALENTLIIFTSDNGGVVNLGGKTGTNKLAMDAGLKINGDLRGGKHDIWEGGFKVPFLVRWPGRVPAGTTSNELIGVVDVFATVAAVVGETKLDRTTTAPDSVNVLSALLGQPSAQPLRRDLILQSANGVYAIRSGPWKWIEGVPLAPQGKKAPAATGPKADQFRPRLVNLVDDPAEKNDVAAAHPEIATRLAETLRLHRAQGFSRD
jgi:arylsulfatase A-like enzyme